MVQEVNVAEFAARLAGGATVVDVREPEEYEAGHVPGARLVPLGALPSRLAELRVEPSLYVICASGNRSATAARWLFSQGLTARSVVGGTSAWTNAGHPVVRGPHENVV